MPTFVPPDTCMADYHRRRGEFISNLVETEPDPKIRHAKIVEWFQRNTPYSPAERLENLKRALYKDV